MPFLSLLLMVLAWFAPANAADVILRVRANAAGAEVFLDGAPLGVVPVTTYIAPGAHQLRVVADNFDPFVRRFEVSDGKAVDVNATLTPGRGTVEWNGPPGARLWVDTIERGGLPIRLPALPPGPHTWRVEAPKYEPGEGTLDVVAGKNYLVDVDLRPSKGIFVVETSPAGASVYLDGRKVGTTPWRAEQIPPGEHGVMVSLAGYASAVRSVDTSDGSRGEVITTLATSGATIVVPTGGDQGIVFVNDVPVGQGSKVTAGPFEKGRVVVRVVNGDDDARGVIQLPSRGTVELRVSGDDVDERPPLVKRWGFWAAVAGGTAVVAGGATAAAIASQPEPLPAGDSVETLP